MAACICSHTQEIQQQLHAAGELDDACTPLLDEARSIGARVWVVSEYGHCDVRRAVEPNRALRRAGFLSVRPGA